MFFDDESVAMQGDEVKAWRVIFIKAHFRFIRPQVDLAASAGNADVGNTVFVHVRAPVNVSEENTPETIPGGHQRLMQFLAIEHAHGGGEPFVVHVEG